LPTCSPVACARAALRTQCPCFKRWVLRRALGATTAGRHCNVRDPRGPSDFCMYRCKTPRAMSVLRIHGQTSARLCMYMPAPGTKDQLCMTRQLTASDMYVRDLIAPSGLSVFSALSCRMVFGCIRYAPCLQPHVCSSHASPPASSYICEPSTYVANAWPIPAHTYAWLCE
jgi:hypothetical protein